MEKLIQIKSLAPDYGVLQLQEAFVGGYRKNPSKPAFRRGNIVFVPLLKDDEAPTKVVAKEVDNKKASTEDVGNVKPTATKRASTKKTADVVNTATA